MAFESMFVRRRRKLGTSLATLISIHVGSNFAVPFEQLGNDLQEESSHQHSTTTPELGGSFSTFIYAYQQGAEAGEAVVMKSS